MLDTSAEYTVQSDHFASCISERKLWAEVISGAAYRAMSVAEGSAIDFFRTRGGQFTTLCFLLGLPEDSIRKRVVNAALATLNQKLNKEK